MVRESLCGQMVRNIKGLGSIIKLLVLGSSIIVMVTLIKAIGPITKLMGRARIKITMVVCMKVNGKTTNNREQVEKNGQREPNSKDIM